MARRDRRERHTRPAREPARERASESERVPRDHRRKAHPRGPTRRRVLVRRAVAASVFVAVVVIVITVLWSPILGVRSVAVTGTRDLTQDQVLTAAAVQPGTPMLRLDVGAIEARVRRLPRVFQVQVSREWPSTVRIDVTERDPIGYLAQGDGSHLVDITGVDYAVVATPPTGLPKILLSSVSPADQRTQAVVGVLAALPAQLKSLVLTIDARTPGSVTLGLTGGRTVRWGDAADSARKAEVLAAVMTRPGKVYDVSSPELPTVS